MRLLKATSVRVITPRKKVRDVSFLEELSKTVKRMEYKDGYYQSATFEFNDRLYIMDSCGNLSVWNDNTDTFIPKRVSFCKGGLYPSYSFYKDGKAIAVMAYKLSLFCLTSWFLDSYIEDDGLVVNHCIVERETNYISGIVYRTRPVREFSFNPKALELVTYSQNSSVAKFVDELDLYGVYVSAEDMDELYEYILEGKSRGLELTNKELTVLFYEAKWATNYNDRFNY